MCIQFDEFDKCIHLWKCRIPQKLEIFPSFQKVPSCPTQVTPYPPEATTALIFIALLDLPILELSRIVQYIFFCVWLFLFCSTLWLWDSSMSLPVLVALFYCWMVFHCMDTLHLFIHSPEDGHICGLFLTVSYHKWRG